MGTFIHGVAASENIDSSGERLLMEGLDISSLEREGVFNYEHKSDQPSQVVGKILKARKIFSDKDCEDDHQLNFWNRVQTPFLYVMGELMDEFKPSAKEIAGEFMYNSMNKGKFERDTIGFSIEGSKIDKKGIDIVKSIARKVTLTALPCNKACVAEMVSADNSQKPDVDSIFKNEPGVEIQVFPKPNLIDILKKEDPEKHAKALGIKSVKKVEPLKGPQLGADGGVGGPTSPGGLLASEGSKVGGVPKFSQIAPPSPKTIVPKVVSGGVPKFGPIAPSAPRTAAPKARSGPPKWDQLNTKVNKTLGASSPAMMPPPPLPKQVGTPAIKKALDAGSAMAAPSQLTQGAALGKESLDKKSHRSQWLKRAEEEYQKWEKREEFRSWMAKKMPSLAMGEIDAIGRTIALQKALKAESSLQKMFQHSFMVRSEPKEKKLKKLFPF